MVGKFFTGILLMVLASGCCYVGKTTTYGLPRKPISELKSGIVPYAIVDTTVLYKLVASYHYNPLLKNYIYFEREDDKPRPITSYLKFYGNGKLGLFVIDNSDTKNLKRDDFDPLKAKMGYYSLSNDGVLKTRISTIGDCALYISNKTGYLRNDTLKTEDRDNRGHIYIKTVVPPEWLTNWKPDW